MTTKAKRAKKITVTEFAIRQLEEVRRLEAANNDVTEEWAAAVEAAEKAVYCWLHETQSTVDDIMKRAAAKAGR